MKVLALIICLLQHLAELSCQRRAGLRRMNAVAEYPLPIYTSLGQE